MTAKLDLPRQLLVLGARPHALALVDMFSCLSDRHAFVGLVENLDRSRAGEIMEGLPVHWHEDIAGLADNHGLVCGLSTTLRRAWIEECLRQGFRFPPLLHPSSVLSPRTSAGAGVIVDAGCVVAGFTTLRDHCRIGRRCSIGHHTTIGRFSTVHPGCVVSGHCTIGEQVLVGTGAVITDGISIGDGAVIAPGSVVRRPVPERALVAGPFARIAKSEFGPR